PLALYLLTFVAVFRDRPWISDTTPAKLAPFAVAPLAIGLLDDFWLGAGVLNLAAFFVLALACPGELYRRPPAPAHLTAFYLSTSFGGVLGGAFAGLLAPIIFPGTYEYRILLVAALAALPGALAGGWRRIAKIAALAVAAAGAVALSQF